VKSDYGVVGQGWCAIPERVIHSSPGVFWDLIGELENRDDGVQSAQRVLRLPRNLFSRAFYVSVFFFACVLPDWKVARRVAEMLELSVVTLV
jgi:hypothetical protein